LKRNWHIQSTCAITGKGLYEGLDWLAEIEEKNEHIIYTTFNNIISENFIFELIQEAFNVI